MTDSPTPKVDPTSPLGDTLRELIQEWESEVAEFATKDDPYYNGVRQCISDLDALVRAVPLGAEDTVPVKPMRQWHNSRYAGQGVGRSGPFRVVIRTDRKTVQQYIELLHDDDAGGFGFTKRQARELIPLLHTALAQLALPPVPVEPAAPREWTALDGSLTIRFLQYINAKRAERWHGLNSWSALEWAGAMSGEAGEANGQVIELLSTLARFNRHVGEAANAAKKLKRIEDGIANINLEDGRSLTDVQNASAKIVDEIADTVIYGVLLASRVGMDLEEAIRMKFNRKSEEYGFPERIPPNQPPVACGAASQEPTDEV